MVVLALYKQFKLHTFCILSQSFCREIQIICGVWKPRTLAFRMYAFNTEHFTLQFIPHRTLHRAHYTLHTWNCMLIILDRLAHFYIYILHLHLLHTSHLQLHANHPGQTGKLFAPAFGRHPSLHNELWPTLVVGRKEISFLFFFFCFFGPIRSL